MSTDILLSDLGFALARGDVALWVGPDGLPIGPATEIQLLTDQPWLGIWSESRETKFAQGLDTSWRKRAAARMVIEVPDLVEILI